MTITAIGRARTRLRPRPPLQRFVSGMGLVLRLSEPVEPIDRVDMFTRFFHGRGTWVFEAEVIWVDGPDGRELVAYYGPQSVAFRPGDPVRDYVFVLRNVPLPGVGRYRIHLLATKPRRRDPVATEYFEVRRT